jgi:hypothetical protein
MNILVATNFETRCVALTKYDRLWERAAPTQGRALFSVAV